MQFEKRACIHLLLRSLLLCILCDYYKGTMVNAAKNLLTFAEKYGSLRLIAIANSLQL